MQILFQAYTYANANANLNILIVSQDRIFVNYI